MERQPRIARLSIHIRLTSKHDGEEVEEDCKPSRNSSVTVTFDGLPGLRVTFSFMSAFLVSKLCHRC